MKTIIFLIALLAVSSSAFAWYNQDYNSPSTTYYAPTGNGGYIGTNPNNGVQTYVQPAYGGGFMVNSNSD